MLANKWACLLSGLVVPLEGAVLVEGEVEVEGEVALVAQEAQLGVNSIALLKSQQTFQQSFYSSVGHPVVLETLLKSLLRFQQSY